MNQEDFITAIKKVVHDGTIRDIKTTLIQPTGRKPYQKLKKLSAWFNALPGSDKTQAMEVIRLSVHASIFRMLCVLDGVTAIKSTSHKGEINLTFIKDGKHTRLNDPEAEMLHDIYQSQAQVEVFGKEPNKDMHRITDKPGSR
jgi:hypothetical protein